MTLQSGARFRAAAMLVVAGLLAACSPGGAPSSAPTPTAVSLATETTAATQAAPATPSATMLGELAATMVPLGDNAAPIDVTFAFGSIWVANHHDNSVTRIDPETLEIVAVIPVGRGPGWFAVTEDTLWVSNQNSNGMTEIDPATNASVGEHGIWPPCGAPLVALGKIWQSACDAGVIMRVDPAAGTFHEVSLNGRSWIALAGDRIVASGPKGLARLDPKTDAWTEIGGCCGDLIGADTRTAWVSDQNEVRRVDVKDGSTVATLPITFAGLVMRVYGDHAWLLQEATAAHRIDLATNEITLSVPIRPEPLSAIEADGALWVTSWGGNSVWRVELE